MTAIPISPKPLRPMLAGRFFSAFALILGLSSEALAAPTPEDVALSEALFREGKTLLQERKFDLACPKLAESQRLDPAGGTLVTLGLCYEGAGKLASAWVVFGEALAAAERDKRADRIKLAKEHVVALEKRLSYLTIELAPEGIGVADFTLTRDGANVNRAALGTASAVDPGKHVITVTAPGFIPYTADVEIGAENDRKKVVIPPLVKEPEKPVEKPIEKPVEKPIEKPVEKPIEKPTIGPPVIDEKNQAMHPGRVGALVLGATSVVALGVGGYFGLQAKSQHDEALELCPASPCPSDKGIEQNEAAKSSAALSTGFVAGGLVGLAGSVVLWVVMPKHAPAKTSPPTVSFLPVVSPQNTGAFLVGSF
jgi:hypothetical protein